MSPRSSRGRYMARPKAHPALRPAARTRTRPSTTRLPRQAPSRSVSLTIRRGSETCPRVKSASGVVSPPRGGPCSEGVSLYVLDWQGNAELEG